MQAVIQQVRQITNKESMCDLASYAAEDAMKTLLNNWTDAVKDDPSVTNEQFRKMVLGDLKDVIGHLDHIRKKLDSELPK